MMYGQIAIFPDLPHAHRAMYRSGRSVLRKKEGRELKSIASKGFSTPPKVLPSPSDMDPVYAISYGSVPK